MEDQPSPLLSLDRSRTGVAALAFRSAHPHIGAALSSSSVENPGENCTWYGKYPYLALTLDSCCWRCLQCFHACPHQQRALQKGPWRDQEGATADAAVDVVKHSLLSLKAVPSWSSSVISESSESESRAGPVGILVHSGFGCGGQSFLDCWQWGW